MLLPEAVSSSHHNSEATKTCVFHSTAKSCKRVTLKIVGNSVLLNGAKKELFCCHHVSIFMKKMNFDSFHDVLQMEPKLAGPIHYTPRNIKCTFVRYLSQPLKRMRVIMRIQPTPC